MKDWDPEQVLRDMEMEAHLDVDSSSVANSDGSTDYKKTAERLIQENLPAAAACLVHLGMWSQDEKIRLAAAKEILNRGLGKITDAGIIDESTDPLAQFTGTFIKEAEEYANAGAPDNTSTREDLDDDEV